MHATHYATTEAARAAGVTVRPHLVMGLKGDTEVPIAAPHKALRALAPEFFDHDPGAHYAEVLIEPWDQDPTWYLAYHAFRVPTDTRVGDLLTEPWEWRYIAVAASLPGPPLHAHTDGPKRHGYDWAAAAQTYAPILAGIQARKLTPQQRAWHADYRVWKAHQDLQGALTSRKALYRVAERAEKTDHPECAGTCDQD